MFNYDECSSWDFFCHRSWAVWVAIRARTSRRQAARRLYTPAGSKGSRFARQSGCLRFDKTLDPLHGWLGQAIVDKRAVTCCATNRYHTINISTQSTSAHNQHQHTVSISTQSASEHIYVISAVFTYCSQSICGISLLHFICSQSICDISFCMFAGTPLEAYLPYVVPKPEPKPKPKPKPKSKKRKTLKEYCKPCHEVLLRDCPPPPPQTHV